MIIDTSAVLAILFADDDAERYASTIAGAEVRLKSTENHLEAGIVVNNQIGACESAKAQPRFAGLPVW